MVGWVRADLRGEVGDEVVLQYAERLNPDGTVYTANLRGAPQRDVCILGRTEVTRFEPHFTYHGFRYVQVTGLAVPPVQGDVVGRVFHNAAPKVGTFDSDSPLLNQLMHNVEWVQRGNMHSSPTDCPQRDERLGWMGDIQAFSQTAAFNMDMAAFLTKWLADVRDAQLGDGRFPDFAPQPFAAERFHGTPAWGDAAVFVPWKMWVNYGDRRLLEKHFDAMLAWNEYVLAGNPDMLWTRGRGNDYGDWLNGDTLLLEGYPHGTNEVPKDVMATAFWKRSTELLARIAGVLGHAELEESLALRAEAIRSAFREAYVDADGRIAGDTQAGYALALRFGMLEGTAADRALEHLVAAIRAYRDHPSTGIQSTHRMLIELSERGLHQEAGRLVMLEDVPSWGYMVRMGATTIWERWDGFVEGRGFQNPGMNSFNHWALGSVGEWVWRTLVGINPDPEHPAYRHVEIRPRPLPGLTRVDGEHLSVRGPVRVAWELGAGEFRLDIQLPPGTEGTVVVPCRDPNRVTESGLGIEEAEGIESLPAREPGTACFAVGSGSYRLIVPQ
jgi:alpha-L-rhamnosidase